MDVPQMIDGFRVIEYGFFPDAMLPKSYVPPSDGRPPLERVRNLAICRAAGVDGFYLLYFTPEWKRVTYSYHETIDATEKDPIMEFAHEVADWKAA